MNIKIFSLLKITGFAAFAFMCFALASSVSAQNGPCENDVCRSSSAEKAVFGGRTFEQELNLFAENKIIKEKQKKKKAVSSSKKRKKILKPSKFPASKALRISAKKAKKNLKPSKPAEKEKAALPSLKTEIENHSGDFRKTSTIIHFILGLALFFTGIIKFHAFAKQGKSEGLKYIPPLILSLAGILSLAAITGIIGNWSWETAVKIIQIKPGFFVFISLAFLSICAGFSDFLFLADEKNSFWKYITALFLAGIALIFIFMHKKVNPSAESFVMSNHAAMGGFLLAYVILNAYKKFSDKKAVKALSLIFLLITSLLLMTYAEREDSFGYKLITVEVSPANGK